MKSTVLQCSSCAASRLVEMDGEICMRFPERKGLSVEPVMACQKLTVCLDCGSVQSDLSPKELRYLRQGAARFEEGPAQSDRYFSEDAPDRLSLRERILTIIIVTLCLFDVAIGWLLLAK